MPTLTLQRVLRLLVANPRAALRSFSRAQRRILAQHAHARAVGPLYDPLTGLASRHLLRDRLTYALRQADRYGHNIGMLHFGLDDFSLINERLGADVGDELLKQIGARVSGKIRGSDMLSRHGSDQFTLLIERLGSPTGCERIADVVLRELFSLGSDAAAESAVDISLTASIGILIHRPDPLSPGESRDAQVERRVNQLLKDVRAAMEQAKLQGKARWYVAGAEEADAHGFRSISARPAARRAL